MLVTVFFFYLNIMKQYYCKSVYQKKLQKVKSPLEQLVIIHRILTKTSILFHSSSLFLFSFLFCFLLFLFCFASLSIHYFCFYFIYSYLFIVFLFLFLFFVVVFFFFFFLNFITSLIN